MGTSEWYFDDRPESRQYRFRDGYIKMMYWSRNHVVSMHQNGEDLKSNFLNIKMVHKGS